MKIGNVTIEQIKKTNSFLATFQLRYVSTQLAYTKLLNKIFKKNKKEILENLAKIQRSNTLNKGQIVIKHKPNGSLLFELVRKKKENKFRYMLIEVFDKRVSAEYLLWFFSQRQVEKYLELYLYGSFIKTLPQSILEGLKIPIPIILDKKQARKKVELKQEPNEIRNIIKGFYNDFKENHKANRYETSVILAGAICEAILYEALLEVGVPIGILSDRKTLGSLIEIAQIKELDKTFGISLTHFENIKKTRNKVIHVGAALKRIERGEHLNNEVFQDFNIIIRNFGI